MTQRSIIEYAEAVRRQYMGASKKLKTKIPGEFVAATGRHRKAVIWLLNRRRTLSGRHQGSAWRRWPCLLPS